MRFVVNKWVFNLIIPTYILLDDIKGEIYCDVTLSNDELTALVSAIQLTEEAKREAIERQCGSVKLAGLQTKLAEHIQNNIRFWEQIENERQLKQLRKVIKLAENDPRSEYTTEEIRYMKKRFRQLEEYYHTLFV